ncbi:MAG: hypothetical protein Ta2F_09430 [Termitinemataceae bacterium]|nr:MAG: hypothetical protein Ta2F_09430 [Termitinemataceae bacterium]
MWQKIQSLIALFCILIYAGAAGFAGLKIWTGIKQQKAQSEKEFRDLKDFAARASVLGFLNNQFQDDIKNYLIMSKTLQGVIVYGPNGNNYSEEKFPGTISYNGAYPRFSKQIRLAKEPYSESLNIDGLPNTAISAIPSIIDYNNLLYILRTSLLAILIASIISFSTLIFDVAVIKSNPALKQHDDGEDDADIDGAIGGDIDEVIDRKSNKPVQTDKPSACDKLQDNDFDNDFDVNIDADADIDDFTKDDFDAEFKKDTAIGDDFSADRQDTELDIDIEKELADFAADAANEKFDIDYDTIGSDPDTIDRTDDTDSDLTDNIDSDTDAIDSTDNIDRTDSTDSTDNIDNIDQIDEDEIGNDKISNEDNFEISVNDITEPEPEPEPDSDKGKEPIKSNYGFDKISIFQNEDEETPFDALISDQPLNLNFDCDNENDNYGIDTVYTNTDTKNNTEPDVVDVGGTDIDGTDVDETKQTGLLAAASKMYETDTFGESEKDKAIFAVLEDELKNAIDQEKDLVVMNAEHTNANIDYSHIVEIGNEFFNDDIKIFEKEGGGLFIILPNINIDTGFDLAKEFHRVVSEDLLNIVANEQDRSFLVGVAGRTGRILDAVRLISESSRALEKAREDTALPIVAFKIDVQKYEEYESKSK